jgi:replicative DNA helicase
VSEEEKRPMRELQVINYILDQGSLDILKKGKLDKSYFPGYEAELSFILKHFDKYQVVPDISTFLGKFEDFDLFEVAEAEAALVEALKEEKGYTMVTKALEDVNKKASEDSIEAAQLMKERSEFILKEVKIILTRPGYDLFKNAHERAEEYIKKIDLKGVLGCITNIEKLDRVTHGWIENDFVAITARPEQGKSWIVEYCLLMPWLLQKKRVLMFSLENSKSLVGYRADTLIRHFSNDALMSGNFILNSDEHKRPTKTKKDYMDYVEEIKNFDIPFIVVDGLDSTDRPITMPYIEELIEFYNPDIIGIDQLSLLSPYEATKDIRQAYVQTTRYCRKMVNRIKKPVILVSQSGRESAKMAMKNKDATPELHHIAESDSVGQDATRVISLKQMDGTLKLSLKKNTFGKSNVDVLMKWDIDHGILEPLALEEDDPNQESRF